MFSVIFFVAFAQFIFFSFDVPLGIFKKSIRRFSRYFIYGFDPHPLRQDWKIREILSYMADQIRTANREYLRVGILTDFPHFNSANFNFYVQIYDLPLCFEGGADITKIIQSLEEKKKFLWLDMIIIQESPEARRISARYCDEFNEFTAEKFGFHKIKEFRLPDGFRAIIYKNIKL
jgi:hypothetical protein